MTFVAVYDIGQCFLYYIYQKKFFVCLCASVGVWKCVPVCVCVCVWLCEYERLCVYVPVCLCVCVCVCVCGCGCVCILLLCVCLCVCLFVSMCKWECVCMCAYLQTSLTDPHAWLKYIWVRPEPQKYHYLAGMKPEWVNQKGVKNQLTMIPIGSKPHRACIWYVFTA